MIERKTSSRALHAPVRYVDAIELLTDTPLGLGFGFFLNGLAGARLGNSYLGFFLDLDRGRGAFHQ